MWVQYILNDPDQSRVFIMPPKSGLINVVLTICDNNTRLGSHLAARLQFLRTLALRFFFTKNIIAIRELLLGHDP